MKILKRIKQRIATCSPKSRGQVYTGTNNLPPIRFHTTHGENIRISTDGAIARRVESFCKAIAFSNRPIRVNERVYLKFVELSTSWSGAVRFGFTSNDPITYRNNLPKYACPDLKNKPGNWAKALPERFAQRDAIICFYVNDDGEVMYSINGEERGVFISGVQTNTPLWAIVDVYGNTCAMEFVDPRVNVNLNNVTSNDVNLIVSQLSASSISRESREPLPLVYANVMLQEMPFHKTKGCNIRLSNDRFIAERNSSHYCQGYVFTQRPLNLEEKLVFQILQTDQLYTGSLAFGLTTCNPSQLHSDDMPDDPHQLLERQEYWVVIKDAASAPVAGDEIAIIICDNGEVKMYKNRNAPVTLMHVDHTQKFYAFLDLYGSTIKVKSLGVLSGINSLSRNSSNHTLSVNHSMNLPAQNIIDKRNPKMTFSSSDDRGKGSPTGSNECTVCYEKPINSVLYQCGHMCMCYECARRQWKVNGGQCPICRAVIQDVIRTYAS